VRTAFERRPHLHEFLEGAAVLFELVVFTAGSQAMPTAAHALGVALPYGDLLLLCTKQCGARMMNKARNESVWRVQMLAASAPRACGHSAVSVVLSMHACRRSPSHGQLTPARQCP